MCLADLCKLHKCGKLLRCSCVQCHRQGNQTGLWLKPGAPLKYALGPRKQHGTSLLVASPGAGQAQAELQSSRQKVSLYDSSASPIQLDPGERHDFMVKHDIKEISAYTLICSSSYSTGDGVALQPQYFKFNAANPLSGDPSRVKRCGLWALSRKPGQLSMRAISCHNITHVKHAAEATSVVWQTQYSVRKVNACDPWKLLVVRTKMRTLDQRVLLEACIENATSKPLQLAQVKFETAPGVAAAPIHHSASNSRDEQGLNQPGIWLDSYADSLQVCHPTPAVMCGVWIVMATSGAVH